MKNLSLVVLFVVFGQWAFGQIDASKKNVGPKVVPSYKVTKELGNGLKKNSALEEMLNYDSKKGLIMPAEGYKLVYLPAKDAVCVIPADADVDAYFEEHPDFKDKGRLFTFVCMCNDGNPDSCKYKGKKNKCGGGDCCGEFYVRVKDNGEIEVEKI